MMNKVKTVIVLFSVLLFMHSGLLQAQVPLIIPFSFSQFKNNQIYDIIEFDKEIYISTSKGLFKYDGQEIHTFSLKDGLKDDEVFNFQVYDEKLWFNSITGKLYMICARKKHIEQFNVTEDYIKSFFWHKNTLYYTNNKGYLSTWNVFTTKKYTTNFPNVLGYKVKDSLLYLLHSEFEFSVLDMTTQKFIKMAENKFDNSYTIPIRNKSIFNQDKIYTFYKHKLGTIEQKSVQEHAKLAEKAIIYTIYPNHELVLIGTQEGLYQFQNNTTECIMPDIFVTNIIKDSENTYWITTFNGDIFIIPDIELKTKNLQTKTNSQLRKIYLFQNHILYGTNTGEIFLNHTPFTAIKKNYESGKLNRIMSISADGQNVCIARDDGFFICNLNQRQVQYISAGHTIKKICSEHPDYYVIGAYYIVIRIDKKTKKIIKSYPCPRIIDLVLWQDIPLICSYNNVFCIKNDTIEEVMKNEYLNSKIRFCYYDKEKKELFIVHQSGVNVYDTNLNKIKKIDLDQSYKFNKVQTYHNNIYIASEKGLFIVHQNNPNKMIPVQNLYGLNLYDIAIQKDTLHFISEAGYGYIPLNKLNLALPSFNSEYQLYSDNQLINTKRITIKYPQNVLQLVVIPKTLKYKSKVHYQYSITDNNRVQTTNYPLLSIPLLNSGKYKCTVSTLMENSIIHQDTFEIEFVLPVWKDKNFITFAIILLIAGIVLLYMEYLIRREKRKSYAEKQYNQSLKHQLQAVQSRLNPHFIFNGLQSLQYLVISHQNHFAQKYLNHFASLTRQFLNYSQQEFCSVEEEIAILKNYLNLENIARQHSVTYHFTIKTEDDIILNQRIIPSLILQPLAENIFKHAFPENYPDPKIEISFIENAEKHSLIVEIEDNGIGMPENILPHSKGLQLIYQRLEIINKTYKVCHSIEIIPAKQFNTGTLCRLILQFNSI